MLQETALEGQNGNQLNIGMALNIRAPGQMEHPLLGALGISKHHSKGSLATLEGQTHVSAAPQAQGFPG